MSRVLRWRNAWQQVGLALLLCLLPLPVLAATAIPALDDPVVDTANALSASTRATLREQALQLQARKGAQLQVLVVPSVGDDGIEAYAQRVFEQWQLGRAGVDDGCCCWWQCRTGAYASRPAMAWKAPFRCLCRAHHRQGDRAAPA